ncbi:MAG: ankyrin repeat domain-containing protein [Flavobacterium sp.]|nr:MAG: ankyrin repeat domain-containing protein [Flavobacterium sp.]
MTDSLYNTIKKDDVDKLSKLITRENINVCYSNTLNTPISLTIQLDAANCFEYFLKKGADVNESCDYKVPLYFACKYGDLVMFKKLIKYGASLNPPLYENTTSLEYAEEYNNQPIVEYLKMKSRDPSFSKKKYDSLVFITNIEYNKKLKGWPEVIKEITKFSKKNTGILDGKTLNKIAWDTFLYTSDVAKLAKALSWSEESLKDSRYSKYLYAFHDTYAQLLYKLGKKSEAMASMQIALKLCPLKEKGNYEKTLIKIQKGERTWIN